MAATDTQQFQMTDLPSDGITSLEFSPTTPDLLIAGSWDNTATLYDTRTRALLKRLDSRAPVLDVCFVGTDSDTVSCVGVDKRLKTFDTITGQQRVLGEQEAAIRCVEYSHQTGQILTGSWDKTLRLYDPRSSKAETSRHLQPEKVFAIALPPTPTYELVVAMAGRHVFIYDTRNMKETLQRRESSLKFQTRAVKCMPSGEGYVCSSIEGRIAVEFFDTSPSVQARKYAFKCHRTNVNDVHTVYPVNALAFHPTFGTFASGGADGIVNVWDGLHKKRIRQFQQFPVGVSALAFNCTGDRLAIASSYTWEEGDRDHAPDTIYVRNINEIDVRPKVSVTKT